MITATHAASVLALLAATAALVLARVEMCAAEVCSGVVVRAICLFVAAGFAI